MVFAFLIWRLVDFVVTLVAPRVLPFANFFSYGDQMLRYHVPEYLRKLTNFDGIFFIRIAEHGYSYTEQAYFPMYPLMIRLVGVGLHRPIISGLVINFTALVIGLFLLYKLLPRLTARANYLWVFVFLFAYPTSYYFGVMYTESLFFLFLVSTLYFVVQKKFIFAFSAAYAASLTRVPGVFISLPVLALLISREGRLFPQSLHELFGLLKSGWRTLCVALAPFLGLATYSLYLWRTVGDPLFFISAQESFGAHRSSHLITPFQVLYRYLRIFLTANISFQYFVALMEVFFFAIAILLLAYDLISLLKVKKYQPLRIGLNLFSWTNIIVPSLTGTLTAMPRYTLMSLSIMLVLAELKSRPFKYTIMGVMIILHIIYFGLFIQGYYVT